MRTAALVLQVLMKMTLPEPSPLPIDPATIKTELWGPGRTKFTMEPMVRCNTKTSHIRNAPIL